MSQPFPAVLGGRWSALEGGYQSNDSNGLRLPSPTAYGNLAAWYDVSDYSSLRVDGSNRVSLIADKSGNSGTNCLCLNGTSANFASVPDSVPLSITSDLEIRMRHSAADWTPASAFACIAKWSTVAGNRSYGVQVETNGRLTLFWSEDGTALKSVTSTAAPSVSDLGTISWRITLDVNDGAGNHVVTFYTATDFSSWVQLGNVVTTAGTTSIFDGNESVNIGRLNSSGGALNGNIYRAQIYNGINGTLAFDANFATASKLATSFTESSSNAATVTINSSGDLGARISGERDLVQLTASKQPIYVAPAAGTSGINSSAFAELAGSGYDTFSGATATGFTAIKTGTAGTDIVLSAPAFAVKVGRRYRATFTLTLNSGSVPNVRLRSRADGATLSVETPFAAAGANSITFTCSSSFANGGLAFSNSAGESTNYTVSNVQFEELSEDVVYLYFDGSDDYMKAAAFSLSQPETIYFTGQQVSWTASDVFFDGGSTNGGLVYQRASTPNLGMFAGTDVGTNGNLAVGTNGLVSAVFNGASSSLRVNRTAAVTGNCGANNPNGFTLGVTANGASGPSNIRTNEVCIYAAAHDTSVQDRIIQYAGRKWGVSGV